MEVIVSLSREPWSCPDVSGYLQSVPSPGSDLPSWPLASGGNLGHYTHVKEIQLRNCSCSPVSAWGTPIPNTSVRLHLNTGMLRLLKICSETANVEGIISSNRTASRGCYKYKRIKSNNISLLYCMRYCIHRFAEY